MLNCVMELQTILFFFFIIIISSDSEEVKKNLTGTEGGSITLPDNVAGHGFLLFGAKAIAMVHDEKIYIYEEKIKDRLMWNKNTDLFTITGLQRSDSGIYTIDPKAGGRTTSSYKLTVYESVPTPAVNTLNASAESCTLLCSVERAEETTLLWYRDEVMVNQSSSAFSLPLMVHKQDFSSSYRCVAANPAEEKTVPINVIISCGGQYITEDSERHHTILGILIPIVFAVIVLLVACTIKWKCFDQKNRHTQVNREPEIQYTDIRICEDRRQVGHGIDSSGPVDHSNLTTIYDILEPHRMVYTDTADQTMDNLQTTCLYQSVNTGGMVHQDPGQEGSTAGDSNHQNITGTIYRASVTPVKWDVCTSPKILKGNTHPHTVCSPKDTEVSTAIPPDYRAASAPRL